MPTKLRELTLPDPNLTTSPARPDMAAFAEIGLRMSRSRRRLNIMSALATGHLPWGVEWEPWLSRHGNEWPLCCGHVLGFREAQAFVAAGLLTPAGSPANTRPIGSASPFDLVITDAGRTWLQQNWDRPARAPEPRPAKASIVRRMIADEVDPWDAPQ